MIKQYKSTSMFTLLFILLLFAIVIATMLGGVTIPLKETVTILLSSLPLIDLDVTSTYEKIILQIRLPRVLVAGLVGAGLAVAGVVMQSIFRNPMADPGIIGVSSGGALGGVVAIYFGFTAIGSFMIPVFGFIGAFITLSIVYVISTSNGRTSVLTLLLTGVAISSFLSACTSLILTYSNLAQVQQILYWLMGDLNGRDWDHLQLMIIPVLISCVIFYIYRNELDILLLGEEEAKNLGINVQFTRNLLLIVASILTGVCVSLTGAIGFVGLIVPHMIRLLIGPSHKYLIPASILGGAIFLILADLIARLLIRPAEIQIGIITAFFGAPFFIYLIILNKRKELD
ncbi:FecCD family ABC transporter permease [Solibacillus silvestris]|uniref:FecCD family ABC transporter permease n=1 Tax=Solibacillus silvestris TaxID=76853 RepID=UPI003F7ECB6E